MQVDIDSLKQQVRELEFIISEKDKTIGRYEQLVRELQKKLGDKFKPVPAEEGA
jgi:peptidoglycan hydrolase CwlO-like protein